jgi:tRNA A-37 threonylcarbamoyl transferase component Bud32
MERQMATPEFVLQQMNIRYSAVPVNDFYASLYEEADDRLRPAFAYFHEQLNSLLGFMNNKKLAGGHYNADPSRELIALTREIGQLRSSLKRAGVVVNFSTSYESTLSECGKFLSMTQGSTIPEDFSPIELEEFDPIFFVDGYASHVKDTRSFETTMIGEGSYALVYKYRDTDYRMDVAVKAAKKSLASTELQRFRAEFELLARLNYPFVLTVYSYDESSHRYTMEYCNENLKQYMERVNSQIPFWARKRLARQFLGAVNYLAEQQILHRDLSFTNVLVKHHDGNLVTLKLSDFGLYKDQLSDLTRTGTEMKGSLIDPALESYKDYTVVNEIYSIGYLLAYIFTGRRGGPTACAGRLQEIVMKCVHPQPSSRYQSVRDIAADVDDLAEATI